MGGLGFNCVLCMSFSTCCRVCSSELWIFGRVGLFGDLSFQSLRGFRFGFPLSEQAAWVAVQGLGLT